MLALASHQSSAKDRAKPPSMRFAWQLEGPEDRCGTYCRTWISASGVVTEHTARDFETFAQQRDMRGATLVLDSEGGSVLAALALGRAIRTLDMTTTIGRTTVLPANGDEAPRAALASKATCESMCAFILLGGTRRYVPPEARVMVHQIWLGSKAKKALESSYTAEELGVVQRDIGKLARYLVEMDAGIELLETALRVPPWEPMYALSVEELRRLRVTTVDQLYATNAPAAIVPPADSNPLATSAQAQRAGN
jgi:hypothetical protein